MTKLEEFSDYESAGEKWNQKIDQQPFGSGIPETLADFFGFVKGHRHGCGYREKKHDCRNCRNFPDRFTTKIAAVVTVNLAVLLNDVVCEVRTNQRVNSGEDSG